MMNSSRRPICSKRRRRSQRGGGNGYRLDPRMEQIAGQAVVVGYDSRVPPIFNGELMRNYPMQSNYQMVGGKRRKSKKRLSKKRRSSKRHYRR